MWKHSCHTEQQLLFVKFQIHIQLLIFVMCFCPTDEMEFEVTSDQRTGKPIACRVVRLEAGSVSFEVCFYIYISLMDNQLNIVSLQLSRFNTWFMSGMYRIQILSV